MAGRIRRDDIETLRERADIVDVVSDHTKLTRAGSRWKGLCPFHSEKTPSFHVDPARNLFHCFGCNEGGDIYHFLMKIEGLDFTEAVEQLARRTNFTLHYEELTAGQKRALGERSRLLEVTAAAQRWFQERLYSSEGELARDYLKQRGFGKEDAEQFLLGYAPNEWEALSRDLVRDGFSHRDLVDAGVAVKNDRGGLRDVFRGRLIFPVRDLSGDVIGFGGRVLPGLDYGDFDPPKYLNSRETRLYHKQRVLYGLHEGRSDVVREEEVLVCEGYTDVMALHQAGFANAVATCGTAVGQEHLRILGRYAQRIVLAFDPDEAGAKAATRAWEEARKLEQGYGGPADDDRRTFDLRVLILPEGKDPADLVADEGVERLREIVADAVNVVPFLLGRAISGAELEREADQTAALREALTILGDEPDPELRRLYVRNEIAPPLGLSVEFVARTAQRMGIELDRHEGVADLAPRRQREERGAVVRPDHQRARRERAVLRLALQRPDLLPPEWRDVEPSDWTHPKAQAVFGAIVSAGGVDASLEAVLDQAPDDELRVLIRELALEDPELPEDPDLADLAGRDLVRSLLIDRIKSEQTQIIEVLERLNPDTDPDRWRTENQRLQALERRRRELAS
ncbi:MAG: DNA primase [Nitriliruptorales bacterium]|nr:DNA primase [Nitriliruptorales bacterium]